MDEELLSETLEALSDAHLARATSKSVRTLRGVRGVPQGEIARVAAAAWAEGGADLDVDAAALSRLFAAAWEDGLLAIALVAAALPDNPEGAWELGWEWVRRVDDLATADALGWLVLGPSRLAMGRPLDPLFDLASADHVAARRAAVMAAMAMTPTPIEGPAAAALRERLGERKVALVAEPLSEGIGAIVDAFLRDPAPEVRKGLRRVLRAWAQCDPDAMVAWSETVRGGLPKMLGDEVQRARRRMDRPR